MQALDCFCLNKTYNYMSEKIFNAILGKFDGNQEESQESNASTDLIEDQTFDNLNQSQNEAVNYALKNDITIIQGSF